MLCEECGKRTATVYWTQIINDEISEKNLCEECAGKKGINELSLLSNFGLPQLISGLSNLGEIALPLKKRIKCNECGLDYEDFKKIGRLGCSKCYQYFRAEMLPLLRKIHGKTTHSGKLPLGQGTKIKRAKEIMDLKRQLQQAIDKEEYEKAAQLRDKIRDREKNES